MQCEREVITTAACWECVCLIHQYYTQCLMYMEQTATFASFLGGMRNVQDSVSS